MCDGAEHGEASTVTARDVGRAARVEASADLPLTLRWRIEETQALVTDMNVYSSSAAGPKNS